MRARGALAGMLGSFGLLVIAPAGALAQRSDELPAEALVAVVGAETPSAGTDEVLLSDVELRARIEVRSAGHDVTRERLGVELYAATLEEIVGELLVAREAARLGQPAPSDEAVRAQRDRLALSVGGGDAMRTLLADAGATDDELDAIARRRAVVEAFFRANLEGNTSISDAELAARHASGEHPFGDRPLEEVREALRAWLAMAALRRDVARWLHVLRDRSVVRVAILPDRSADEDAADADDARADGEGD